MRDSGTGFCLSNTDPDGAYVVTCAHVVSNLDPGQSGLRVNGRVAKTIISADDRGIDLAILKAPKLEAKPAIVSTRPPSAGAAFEGMGYIHLHGGQYVSRVLRGTVKQVLTMRAQHSLLGTSSLLLSGDENTAFEPGNSGSPIFDAHGEVIGVLAFASRDGRTGYAVSIGALHSIVPRDSGIVPLTDRRGDSSLVSVRPLPPALGPVTVSDDSNKGRFGGDATDGQVELSAVFRRKSGSSYFAFDVSVAAIQRDLQLLGPARFYLHDTYPKTVIQITRRNSIGGFTLSEVTSYGVFTVGCHVFASDNQWHAVEYDLVDLPDLPNVFKGR